MTKYLIKRLLRGLISVFIVVVVVMLLVFTLIDREFVFRGNPLITKKSSNEKIIYKYQCWENYGYLDYFRYTDYLDILYNTGEIDQTTRNIVSSYGKTASEDPQESKPYISKFYDYCSRNGYTVVRLDADMSGNKLNKGGAQQLFAYKDIPILERLGSFFSTLITVDTIHYVKNDEDLVGDRGISFTFFDPVYGGEKFSPAIIGNGTKHKYLLYFDNQFPFIHQNVVTIRLGVSYSISMGNDVYDSMTKTQGSLVQSMTVFPSGIVEMSSNDMHTATYSSNVSTDDTFIAERYTDKYVTTDKVLGAPSRIALSFIMGILSSILAYLIGVPVGIGMARRKGKWFDKLSTAYIVFILAVPSLAYIFIFRAFGMKLGLPGQFDIDDKGVLQYVLPIVSLALPSIAGLMQWLRRYMIDQMNSDYVKFARSGGMSERGIFNKHILKNAAIPLIHNIPGVIVAAIVGAIITETVYSVPGTGRMLTNAITKYDNSVIVGLTAFYALLSILSIIAGDILMALVDPRISYTDKAR